MGIKLCGRQVSRTNEHEFEVQETSNKAVASVLENLLRDHFAWIAITATAIRRRMDLLLHGVEGVLDATLFSFLSALSFVLIYL